jgi:hypothetical protein
MASPDHRRFGWFRPECGLDRKWDAEKYIPRIEERLIALFDEHPQHFASPAVLLDQ